MKPENKLSVKRRELSKAVLINWIITSFMILALWPGVGTNDSFTQISGFLSGSIDGTHSPMMTVLWGIVFDLTGEFGAMMALHVLLLGLSIHIFIVSKRHGSGWVFLFFWISPWVLNFINVVWKDVLLGSLLLLASALIFAFHKDLRLSKTLIVSLVLSIALGARANAILAILPFMIYLGFQTFRSAKTAKIGLLNISMLVGLITIPSIVVGPAFGASPGHGQESPMVDDLSVVSLANQESLVPGRTLEEIRECEESSYFSLPRNGFIRCLDGYNFGDDGLRGKIPTSLWLSTVFRNLDVIIPHRVDKYWAFLWQDGDPYSYSRPFTATSNKDLPDEIGWNFQQNTTSYARDAWVEIWAKFLPFVFLPLFWLITSFLVFSGSLTKPRSSLSTILIIISSSSVLYLLGYAVFNLSAEFRYALWPTWAVTISVLLVLAEALKSKIRYST